jgi:hypothetical protein
MAFEINGRPHIIGDLILLNGTIVQADGSTTVDISDHISEIMFVTVHGKVGVGPATGDTLITGSTLTFPAVHPSITGTLTVTIVGKR